MLTNEHPASSYGQPVLVKRATDEAWGRLDVVEMYPSWGLMLAVHAVERAAAAMPKLTDEERRFIASFTGEQTAPSEV